MKLIRLEMTNFRQHLRTVIDFIDGVTGIIGPNGAGKTTILEAIAWALYGSPALRGNNDTVRSTAAPGGSHASVVLTFELGGLNYKVSRSLDGSGGHAVLEAADRTLHSGTREVNAGVARLLRMDYQAFFTSFFTAQKELEFMATMDGRARAAAISRMLGYDRLTKARDQANADRLGVSKAVEALERQLGDPEEIKQRKKNAQTALAQAKRRLEEAESASKSAQELFDKLKPLKEASDQKAKRQQELTHSLQLCRARITEQQRRIAELEREVANLRAKSEELERLRAKLTGFRAEKEELKKLSDLERFEPQRHSLLGQIAQLESDLDGLRRRERECKNAKEVQARAEAAFKVAEAQLARTDKELQEAREARIANLHSLDAQIGQLQDHAAQIAAKRAQIEQAGADGKCPTCERPLAGELPRVLANFDSQAAEIDSRIAALAEQKAKLENDGGDLAELERRRETVAAELERLRAEKSNADRRAEELVTIRDQIKEKADKLDELRRELDKLPTGFNEKRFRELQELDRTVLQPDRDRGNILKGELERLPKAEEELAELREQIVVSERDANEYEKALADLGFSQKEHEQLVRDYEDANTALNAAKVALEEERGEVKTAAAIMSKVEEEEASYKARVNELNAKRSERLHLDTVARAFDALRSELNTRIRPELQDTASEFLSQMTDGRYNTLEIDDSYRAVIVDDGERKPVISGGEDDIVNLALRLAVSQMIADRAGQSFSLLVLDEVFGSLDDSRRGNVVSLLQNLKNRFEQIILITHVESIHDAVDNCIWVEFDEKTKTSRLAERSVGLDAVPAGMPVLS